MRCVPMEGWDDKTGDVEEGEKGDRKSEFVEEMRKIFLWEEDTGRI